MSRLYSANSLYKKMPKNSVVGKLHCRGEGHLAPTRDDYQRHFGVFGVRISRNILLAMLVLLSSFALAHEGFNTVLENASVNPYTVTVLEDTHLAGEQLQTSLMIQVANGREAAPSDTTVKLTLERSSRIIYENQVPYVGSSSSDGRSFYAYYFVTIPLQDLNSHDLRLELKGSLGTANTTLHFQPKLAPEFRATELIPSLLIIGIFHPRDNPHQKIS
jgi:hypothetical protein